MTERILTLKNTENHWPMQWVNPLDENDWIDCAGVVYPIGQWVTQGGPFQANQAVLMECVTVPETMQAKLVMTVVDIADGRIRNYVPRRDFEEVSQLMERRRELEERADDQATEAPDQASGGEGTADEAAGGGHPEEEGEPTVDGELGLASTRINGYESAGPLPGWEEWVEQRNEQGLEY